MDLIKPYTHKGQNGTEIDFMCLTMINPAMSWKIVELSVVEESAIPSGTQRGKGMSAHSTPNVLYFDKSSAMSSTFLGNK